VRATKHLSDVATQRFEAFRGHKNKENDDYQGDRDLVNVVSQDKYIDENPIEYKAEL